MTALVSLELLKNSGMVLWTVRQVTSQGERHQGAELLSSWDSSTLTIAALRPDNTDTLSQGIRRVRGSNNKRVLLTRY